MKNSKKNKGTYSNNQEHKKINMKKREINSKKQKIKKEDREMNREKTQRELVERVGIEKLIALHREREGEREREIRDTRKKITKRLEEETIWCSLIRKELLRAYGEKETEISYLPSIHYFGNPSKLLIS